MRVRRGGGMRTGGAEGVGGEKRWWRRGGMRRGGDGMGVRRGGGDGVSVRRGGSQPDNWRLAGNQESCGILLSGNNRQC